VKGTGDGETWDAALKRSFMIDCSGSKRLWIAARMKRAAAAQRRWQRPKREAMQQKLLRYKICYHSGMALTQNATLEIRLEMLHR